MIISSEEWFVSKLSQLMSKSPQSIL
jgi:hypothetical protein